MNFGGVVLSFTSVNVGARYARLALDVAAPDEFTLATFHLLHNLYENMYQKIMNIHFQIQPNFNTQNYIFLGLTSTHKT